MLRLLKFFCHKSFKNVLEIIFPEFCIGCIKIGTLLCGNCYEKLEFLQFTISANKKISYLDSITCCCQYTGLAKKIIHELKYKSVISVGKTIAHIMYYTTAPPIFDLITFVPIHKKKLNQRGFNQTHVIASELSKIFQKPIASLLIKTKHTQSQMSLNQKSDRQDNIIGTITMDPRITKETTKKIKTVLIVDDVFTSGTTLNYCGQILKEFGFKNIHGICFAHRS